MMKSTPYPSRHPRQERIRKEPERSLEKKNREKEEMRARERTHANASTTPTRRKHAKQTRIHAFRAKQRAFLSSKALHNSTPFRGNLPSHTQRRAWASQKAKNVSDSRAASDDANASSASTIDPRAVFASFRANSIAVQSNET
jgi:hypothetical protein